MTGQAVLEVRPSRARAPLQILGFIVFAAFSAVMVLSGDVIMTIIGVLGFLLFGVGGAIATPKLLRADLLFSVDSTGVRPGDGGFVPWGNVEALEEYRAGGEVRALGLRMRDPERYVATLSDEERKRLLTRVRLFRGPRASSTSDIVEYFAFQYRHTGWHMAWTQSIMNHRIEDVLRHRERLRRSAA